MIFVFLMLCWVDAAHGDAVTLLSTSFEDLSIDEPEVITPFAATDDIFDPWGKKHPSFSGWNVDENSKTGELAINVGIRRKGHIVCNGLVIFSGE